MKRLLACALLLSATPALALDGITRQFHQEFFEVLSEEGIPGAAYAVVAGGRIVDLQAWGFTDVARDEPVDGDTVFRLASVSKGFAATVAALVAAEGGFQWHEPVARFQPDFAPAGMEDVITIHDLLGQSTGFVSHAYDHLLEAGASFNDILPRFRELTPVCHPGTCYTYQNNAFSLIQPVLEQVTTETYEALVRQRLLEPLEMRHATVGFEAFLNTANHARPHVRRVQQWRTVDVRPDYYHVGPAAGVNASAHDMAQWLLAMLGHRPEVLPPQVIAEITAPRISTPRDLRRRFWGEHLTEAHYGLGWRVYRFGSERLVYHGGWVSGFRAEAAFAPDRDIGLAILMNAESMVIADLSTRFWARVLAPTAQIQYAGLAAEIEDEEENGERTGQPATLPITLLP